MRNNHNWSITDMKAVMDMQRQYIYKLRAHSLDQYRKGYITGRKHGGTLLVDVADEDLVLDI